MLDLYVDVPKDITKVKTKVAFNLTKRQLICFGVGGVCGIGCYFLTKNLIGATSSMLLMLIVALPFFFAAIYEKLGQPFELVLYNYISYRFKPQIRIYKTENIYDDIKDLIEVERRIDRVVQSAEKRTRQKKRNKSGQKGTSSARTVTKLNYKEKREIERIRRQFSDDRKRKDSVQKTIAYQEMYRNGLCRIDDKKYSRALSFGDINYELARGDDKQRMLLNYCDFLNSIDAGWENVQFFYYSKPMYKSGSLTAEEHLPHRNDDFDDLRDELVDVLADQIEVGNNGYQKIKQMIVTVKAETPGEASEKLGRIESDIRHNFRKMDVRSIGLTGKERLQVMHSLLNQNEDFNFDFKMIPQTGLTTKNFIAPSSSVFGPRRFKMGRQYCAIHYLRIETPRISDRILTDFLNLNIPLCISVHVDAVDQDESIKMIKRKMTDINATKINEQKKAFRNGYTEDLMSPDLKTYGREAENWLEDLESDNEKMFFATILIYNVASTQKELESRIDQVRSIANKHKCIPAQLDYQQERALNSILPLGNNQIKIRRMMNTRSIAGFMPFTTEEIFMGLGSIYYGLNALSNNPILADRTKLKNPNGIILGQPGSGKSFAVKQEITYVILTTNDDVIIVDPEGEYYSLVYRLNGEVVRFSTVTKNFVNPLDLNPEWLDGENPLKLKFQFLLSLFELFIERPGDQGLSALERSCIDICMRSVYRDYLADPTPDKVPILGDMYKEFKRMAKEDGSEEALYLSNVLEVYVNGSLNIFNNRTNINLHNRLVCFDIKNLDKGLRKISMLILQDQVWNRVSKNRSSGRVTRYYCDEFHLLLREKQTAEYSVEIWKRFRKWGGVPTGLTQNVKNLFQSEEIESIFDNSDFILILSQGYDDKMLIAQHLSISPEQLSYISQSNPGEGLLFFGDTILPFVNKFPKDTELYRLMTTKLEEVSNENPGSEV